MLNRLVEFIFSLMCSVQCISVHAVSLYMAGNVQHCKVEQGQMAATSARGNVSEGQWRSILQYREASDPFYYLGSYDKAICFCINKDFGVVITASYS